MKEWTMVERDLAVSQSHGATQQLALRRYRDATNAIILALPRGGPVPRGYEISRQLHLPRPGHPKIGHTRECGMGDGRPGGGLEEAEAALHDEAGTARSAASRYLSFGVRPCSDVVRIASMPTVRELSNRRKRRCHAYSAGD